ncbi:MAG: hypothetical protein COZ92_01260 [Candidatus Nealsonbacteria bacterium CG_4_8_14_3_um_filter_40_11]|uniref:Uncharacterized protein n=1 Tax=Candidatus Nealsonbacteria bacterium CG_4_8_14_3_um_filter_40_11 TaxID=1974690 RepID=A0A2M7IK60_9BACT|nr:MAG: hypothetical protein COZ92_01260 [Candidatus Nealsonbacteria bacterium CG_4_8_14_3_um_filter_40_11]
MPYLVKLVLVEIGAKLLLGLPVLRPLAAILQLFQMWGLKIIMLLSAMMTMLVQLQLQEHLPSRQLSQLLLLPTLLAPLVLPLLQPG